VIENPIPPIEAYLRKAQTLGFTSFLDLFFLQILIDFILNNRFLIIQTNYIL